ncbi:chitin synthase III catalytic subunit-domain-containing protein [Naematelia encephala]|uniref:Chitin synthase III catalytic subunit-domain-containing protein n=1 Tax=Naematelia encephala TaxID=71784 RepID=A0A1Y2BME2_9TREE|nr:chitin synthase III catalytic subunit-domain-containing protein [Naematelia encephala]
MPDPFGAFSWICSHTPLPHCNLFFQQLFENGGGQGLVRIFPASSDFFNQYNVTANNVSDDPNVLAARTQAGVGVGSQCEIPHVGNRGSVGDVALVVISGLSTFFALYLVWHATRRRAAVGRSELRLFLLAYALHSALQTVTMSSMVEQASTAIGVLSAIHVGVIASLFWILLGNGLIATQIVEDGTPAALVPMCIIAILFFVPTLYISLDTTFSWSHTFHMDGQEVSNLSNIALFVLTLVWPAIAAVAYLVIMLIIVLRVLNEFKPALLYSLSFALFAGAQIVFFLASQPLCKASNGKINSSFISTILDTAAVGVLYLAWKSITEDDWGDEYDMY